MYLPDDVLQRIQNFQSLDTEDEDDADFIELYGGLFTLARASNVIEDHGLLADVTDKQAEDPNISEGTESDEAYVSDPAATPAKSEPRLGQPSKSVTDLGVQATVTLADAAAQAVDPKSVSHAYAQTAEPSNKRRKLSIEVSTENGHLVAHIPLNVDMRQEDTNTAERRVLSSSQPDRDANTDDKDANTEDRDANTENRDGNAADRVANTEDSEEPTPESSPEGPSLVKPQDLEGRDRLRLLAGQIDNVDIPHMTSIPSRFGHSPDFGPRCTQCGHKQDPSQTRGRHPVDACPVVGGYGREAFDPVRQRWSAPPCLYPLCPRSGHHFTKMCPELQSLCLRCGLRGHSAPRCDLVTLEYSKEALEDAYRVFAPLGLRSRKKASCPDWEFEPVIPSFRVVTFQETHYLLPWTRDQCTVNSNLSPANFKAELLQELYK